MLSNCVLVLSKSEVEAEMLLSSHLRGALLPKRLGFTLRPIRYGACRHYGSEGRRRSSRDGFTVIELIVAIGILVACVGLLLTAVQRARASATRLYCTNNLKQMGLALQHYHDSYSVFPPGCSYFGGKDPYPHMAWMARLLPYIEQEPLWREAVNAYAQAKFFEDLPHLPVIGQVLNVFACPSDGRSSTAAPLRINIALTSYQGIEGINQLNHDGMLYLDSRVRIGDVTDGTSNTLLVGERPPSADLRFGWWYAGWGQEKDGSGDSVLGVMEFNFSVASCGPGPYSFSAGSTGNQCDLFHYWSLHSGGANFLFVDGSVHFLAYSDASIMTALATRAGHEVPVQPD